MERLRKVLLARDEGDETLFKKWLFLDRTVMTPVHDKSLTKLHRLELLMDDNWDYFTLGLFKWKDIRKERPNISTTHDTAGPILSAQEKRQKRCNKQLDRGGIRKAMSSLLSSNGPITDHGEAFKVLTNRHIQLPEEEANLTRAILKFDSAPIISTDLGGVIRKTSTTTAPDDVTGTRARYVKQMISDGTPDANRYLQMYTSFINKYRMGQFSDKMLLLLNSGQATALQKADSTVRPNGKCEFHRKPYLGCLLCWQGIRFWRLQTNSTHSWQRGELRALYGLKKWLSRQKQTNTSVYRSQECLPNSASYRGSI